MRKYFFGILLIPLIAWATDFRIPLTGGRMTVLNGRIQFGHDWYVATNGTGGGTSWADASSDLQGIITACLSNYTVWVSNGIYTTNLTVGAGVTVRSKNGISTVILNGNASSRVVLMNSSSWLRDCTISNGFLEDDMGSGIYGGNISNVVITDNNAAGLTGAGAGAAYCNIFYSIIKNNIAATGEGVGTYGCSVLNSVVYGNSGKWAVGGKYSTFYNCLITNNTATVDSGGAGVYCTFYNCLVVGNSSPIWGGAGDECTFYNSTVCNNTAPDGGGGYICNFFNSISWNSSPDIFGSGYTNRNSCGVGDDYKNAIGSITNNPIFISETDFRLQASSPCIDKGVPTNYPWMTDSSDQRSKDLDGNRRIWPIGGTNDMGAYEKDSSPW